MDGTTAQRVAEHRDILKGFDAQITRLDREEDELFGRIIRAKDREDAQVVFDGLAKVKAEKEKLEMLKKVRVRYEYLSDVLLMNFRRRWGRLSSGFPRVRYKVCRRQGHTMIINARTALHNHCLRMLSILALTRRCKFL